MSVGAVLDLPPETPEQLAARLTGQLPPRPDAGAIPANLLGAPAGTILPSTPAPSSGAMAAQIVGNQPNAVAPQAAGPAPMMSMHGANQFAHLMPPPPAASQPLAPPLAAPALPPGRRAGGGGGGLQAPRVDEFGREMARTSANALEGVEQTQEAKAAGAEAKAGALGDLSVEQRAQSVERADLAKKQRDLTQHLDAEDAANLKKARDYTIPDFWKGHEGARVGSIISMAMGAVAAGVLGGPNGAVQTINKFTDDYFHKQKEKIDNLYKYAEQTGKANDKTRLRYAQELSDLGAQHAAINQSILTRVSQVEAANQGHVDRAMVTGIKANLEQQNQKIMQDYKTTQQELANHTLTAKANAAQSYAAAAASRATAAAGKTNKTDDSLIYDAQGKPFAQAQTPAAAQKFRDQQRALTDLGAAIGELEQNYKQGIVAPGGLTAAGRQRDATMSRITLAAKTVGELGALSGPDLGLVQDLAGGRVGHLLGSPEGIQNLRRLHQNGMNTAMSQIGAQPTPENMRRFAAPGGAAPAAAGMITIRNAKTGETKQVTRQEAQQLGAI